MLWICDHFAMLDEVELYFKSLGVAFERESQGYLVLAEGECDCTELLVTCNFVKRMSQKNRKQFCLC